MTFRRRRPVLGTTPRTANSWRLPRHTLTTLPSCKRKTGNGRGGAIHSKPRRSASISFASGVLRRRRTTQSERIWVATAEDALAHVVDAAAELPAVPRELGEGVREGAGDGAGDAPRQDIRKTSLSREDDQR